MMLSKIAAAAIVVALGGSVTTSAAAEEIKFGIGIGEGDFPEYNALVRFKEYVEFKTNGEITVRLFPNNQLGSEREMMEQVQQGSLELTFVADGAMAGFYPDMQVWAIPYLFESAPIAWKVMESPFADRMREDILETTGMRALAFSENGFRSFTNNVREVKRPSDLAGMKIRTMESPVYIEMVGALGATAVPIAGAEVLMALRQGVVDGQENPPAVVYGGGLGEVQKYYTLDEHVFGLHVILCDEKWFADLSPSEQQVIRDAAQLMAWTENLQKTEGDWKFSQRLREELDMQVHVSTPEEKAEFKELTQAPVLKFVREKVGDRLVDDLLSEVDAAKAALYK